MHVFVAGATGVLGRRLVARFSGRGDDVTGLVRDDAGAAVVEAREGTPVRGDILDPSSLETAIPDDVDVLVHAATSIPTADKPAREDWAHHNAVRTQGARTLVAAAGERIDRFLFPSVVWVARQPDGSSFDEDATRHPDPGTRGAAEVEDYLLGDAKPGDVDATVLRLGLFYAADDATTRRFARDLLRGRQPVIGGGILGRRDAALSRLHTDDAADAFVAAVDAGVTGCYHVVDEEPVSLAAFLDELAGRLATAGPRFRVPGWLARAALSGVAVDLVTRAMPTTSESFRAETGWEPACPTYREGLRRVVDAWLEAGTIRETATGYAWNDE